MVKKDVVNNEGSWKVLSQTTQGKISRSYMQNGEARTEQEELFGKPGVVQQQTAHKYAGEVSKLNWVHTWTDVEREYHENTTDGVTKRREVRTIQTYDFGDGLPVKTIDNPDGVVYKNPDDEAVMKSAMDKTDYLKNMHDQLDNREVAHSVQNTKDHTMIWMVLVGLGIICGVSIALFIVG